MGEMAARPAESGRALLGSRGLGPLSLCHSIMTAERWQMALLKTKRGITVYSEPSTSSFITMCDCVGASRLEALAEIILTALRPLATVRMISARSMVRTRTAALSFAWLGTAEAATSFQNVVTVFGLARRRVPGLAAAAASRITIGTSPARRSRLRTVTRCAECRGLGSIPMVHTWLQRVLASPKYCSKSGRTSAVGYLRRGPRR